MPILLFLIILVVLILVHEFGHFIVAKRSGIRVDEFGVGFPPKLFGKKYGETEYTVNALPFGGFVKIFGENPDEASISGPDSARSFVRKPKWVQALVLVAGVGFNVGLAWVLLSAGFMAGMPTLVSEEDRALVNNPSLAVVEVLQDSPAEQAGIIVGDTIVSLSAEDAELTEPTPATVAEFISVHGMEAVTVEIISAFSKERSSVVVVPATNMIAEEPERAAIGIAMGVRGTVTYPPHRALFEGGKMTVSMLGAVAVALGGFFISALSLSADLSQVAGPVGIVGLVGDAAALGFVPLLVFTAIISLNLAIINLLPFPALDGGRLLFVFIEALKGSPIKPRVTNIANTVGFAFLILLMLLITYNDIVKLLV